MLIPVQVKVYAHSGIDRHFWLGVDTAATHTMLRADAALAFKIDLQTEGTPHVLRALTSELPSHRIKTKRIMVASMVVPNFPIQFAEIPPWIAEQHLDGLLGLDFLSRFNLQIDFKHCLLTLSKPS